MHQRVANTFQLFKPWPLCGVENLLFNLFYHRTPPHTHTLPTKCIFLHEGNATFQHNSIPYSVWQTHSDLWKKIKSSAIIFHPPGLTSGCLRRKCRFMEARVDTLVPQRWQDWASTFSCVRWTCFCSIYSVRYFLSQVAHVHVLPTATIQKET